MQSTREVMVIGGGPAGVASAVEAARAGAGVTLVAAEPIGGRATHASLVPSKVLLHAAADRRAAARRAGTSDPTKNPEGRLDAAGLQGIVEEIDRVVSVESARLRMRLEDAGVRVIHGTATFVAPDAVELAREGRPAVRERFDAAVVATGSVPAFPDGFFGDAGGPNGTSILAPRHVRQLRDLPRSLLVIGGGASGAEAVHAFASLGVEVTWLLDELGILPDFDRELADALGDVLMERGTKIVHGKRVLRVTAQAEGVLAALDGGRTYTAECAYVAIGRRPDLGTLGLDALGVRRDRDGAIAVDASMRSSVPSILAAGDAAGAPYLASKAGTQGWIAGRVAAGLPAPSTSLPPAPAWVEAVYTEPEVASVGLSAQQAVRSGRPFEVRTLTFDESLRGVLEGVGAERHARGVLRVIVDAETGAVLGGTAVGPRASEVLAPLAVAVRTGATLDMLATSGLASPTLGELAALAGR